MKLTNKKAFSLTELLIVLVVIAILFAALAPIFTKRRTGSNIANESVWNYVNDDDMRDAYYDPGVAGWPSSALFGFNASKISSTPSPISKVIIYASNFVSSSTGRQKHIQFRFGSGEGQNSGTLSLDDKGNLLMASDINFDPEGIADYNTIAGAGAVSNIRWLHSSVIYGANALKGIDPGSANNVNTTKDNSELIAVGNKVLGNTDISGNHTLRGIYIGASSGQFTKFNEDQNDNIAIGSSTMGTPLAIGTKNVYLGSMVGGAEAYSYLPAEGNVIVGSKFSGTSYTNYNTILGYDSFTSSANSSTSSSTTPYSQLTAVGAQACNGMNNGNTGTGSRTCIGYTSGASIAPDNTPPSYKSDQYEHIFLGGVPLGGFNGRGVVEIHNQIVNTSNEPFRPQVSPTVIFNSNLVLRGNLYIPNDDGVITAFNNETVDPSGFGGNVEKDDKCAAYCFGIGGKVWRHYGGCFYHTQPTTNHTVSMLTPTDTCASSETSSLTTYSFSSSCPKFSSSVSDIRLKDNIKESSIGLAEIENLIPYNFAFKSDKDSKAQVGVMAQDLQKVFPSSVSQRKDSFLTIRWDEMFFAMVNAIKSLGSKIEKIASEITAMERDIKQLKTNNKSIQKRISVLNARVGKLERK